MGLARMCRPHQRRSIMDLPRWTMPQDDGQAATYVNHADRPNLVAVWDKQEEHVLVYLNPKRIEAGVDLFTDYGKGGPTKSRGALSVPDSAIENSFEGVVCVIDQRKRGCITQHHVRRPNGTTDCTAHHQPGRQHRPSPDRSPPRTTRRPQAEPVPPTHPSQSR